MTAARRLCSACLAAGRETPARHADGEGRSLAWCSDHCSYEEFVAVTGGVPLQQVRESVWPDLGEPQGTMNDDDAPAEPGARGGV